MSDASNDRRSAEEEPPVVIRDKRKFDSDGNLRTGASTDVPGRPAPSDDAAELAEGQSPLGPSGEGTRSTVSSADAKAHEAIAAELAERTADLQRLTAEYANYRKRVDRDRLVVTEVASARVVEKLLPILDDVERADQHGDLTGAFKVVADKLVEALTALGLTGFGSTGDPFDPEIHEAVMHNEGEDVQVPTATTIMRKGYRLNERLLRPAMVGVTDPSGPVPEESAPE
jgi:molecular chaperone GrpE